jgi:hypothetical protein
LQIDPDFGRFGCVQRQLAANRALLGVPLLRALERDSIGTAASRASSLRIVSSIVR